MSTQINVLGEPLEECGCHPVTGYFRDGYCNTSRYDGGSHTICAQITDSFLEFSLSQGNDLVTPRPEFEFPGLVADQTWCLCASRWLEAHQARVAPPVYIKRTNQEALTVVPLSILRDYAIDLV